MTPVPRPAGFSEEQARLKAVVGDDDMYDLVNLSTRRTGLDGVVYISTAQGRHGPRIKWYPGRPGRDTPCMVGTLDSPPRAINHGLPSRVARQAEAALLAYWHGGLGWTEEVHDAFLDGLKKLP